MKQKVECDTRRTTHVHCEQTRKSEEIYSPLFLLPRQRRGKINVLNNKILRTFETRGDFFFVSFFPFFSFFLLPHFLLSDLFAKTFSRVCKFKASQGKSSDWSRDSEGVQHKFLLFPTFIRRNYSKKYFSAFQKQNRKIFYCGERH